MKKPDKIIKTFEIFESFEKDFNKSHLSIFAVWNDSDKYPYIREFKDFHNGKFVDTHNVEWQHFGIIPKCIKCTRYWKKQCRGEKYNFFCKRDNYKNYEGKQQKKLESPRITNFTLGQWVCAGKGQILNTVTGLVSTDFTYGFQDENEKVKEYYFIRRIGETMWKEPTAENL